MTRRPGQVFKVWTNICAITVAAMAVPAFAEVNSPAGSDYGSALSLEDILNLPSTIAARKALTQRQSPSIISIVTSEEIRNSGARDLYEILKTQVPGIQFGQDVDGLTGIAVRGLWSNAGKVLLLIDGLEANEEVFATLQFQ